jgi:hypothetical protein
MIIIKSMYMNAFQVSVALRTHNHLEFFTVKCRYQPTNLHTAYSHPNIGRNQIRVHFINMKYLTEVALIKLFNSPLIVS